MGKFVNGLAMLALAGLVVAILRQFGWDPFEAAEWAIGKAWDTINHVADLWSGNETFKEATKNPKK